MQFMHAMHFAADLRMSVKIICLLWMVLGILYILTLFNTLRKCSVPSRTMRPGMVWLMLIPLFNMIWQFFVVQGLAQSVGHEFQARRIQNAEPRPGMPVGMAMCVCTVCALFPLFLLVILFWADSGAATGELPNWLLAVPLLLIVSVFAALAHLVLWIIYWSKIASCSRMLKRTSVATVAPNLAPHA
jgi:hypothetical protein